MQLKNHISVRLKKTRAKKGLPIRKAEREMGVGEASISRIEKNLVTQNVHWGGLIEKWIKKQKKKQTKKEEK